MSLYFASLGTTLHYRQGFSPETAGARNQILDLVTPAPPTPSVRVVIRSALSLCVLGAVTNGTAPVTARLLRGTSILSAVILKRQNEKLFSYIELFHGVYEKFSTRLLLFVPSLGC
ncbi:hypothetical protein FHG87_008468 [Trinorchestia longiramus]|nr:hypothetical protein FHG87_008468 [Trinorchestia longiramus]